MSNRLAETKSLYLRKHADNPIHWQYWHDEALNMAKTENKPIFLSIGYSSCHWCTVMEGEAFSDLAIADYLNTHFIPIKVDREERPDLDSIYMQALQMMTGQGGWPLNIFLTPDELIPFYGGTYFPVEARYGRPKFLELLKSINDFYHNRKDKLNQFTQQMVTGLNQNNFLPLAEDNILSEELLKKGIEANNSVLNRNEFGAPRFPMIPYSNAVLQGSFLNLKSEYDVEKLVIQRGTDLANGGIYDHVGGGFHRYTVDATWTVPHFEKMLYDNGLIMEFLTNLWSNGYQKPEFKIACDGTLKWLKREMVASSGYFYAAQDADNFTTKEDNEPEEGAFYVWEYSQLKNLLSPEELAAIQQQFTITQKGNFEGKNVLQRKDEGELLDIVKQALNKLFEVRYGDKQENIKTFTPAKNNQEAKNVNWQGRIPPVTDTKMIVAWNSLMISGLARAYGVFGDQSYLDLAIGGAKFILDNQWQNGRFYRLNYNGEVNVLAQSEDYALFIKALLDLYSNCPDNSYWLEKANTIQQEFDQYFWSLETGGYYNNPADNNENLLIKERSYIDNAITSANGVAISNLIRLSFLTDNQEYLENAQQALNSFATVIESSPTACPTLLTALDWYLNGKIVKTNQEQIQELIPRYLPTVAYKIEQNLPSDAIAIVCQGLSCLEPATTKQQLLSQIGINK